MFDPSDDDLAGEDLPMTPEAADDVVGGGPPASSDDPPKPPIHW